MDQVDIAVGCYDIWCNGQQKISSYTIAQIEQYCQMAEAKSVLWIQ
jgi:hypothetical protein